MHIERFNSLSIPQQQYYTIKCGTYLSTRHEKAFSVDLFELSGYYVEIFYEHGQLICSYLRAFRSARFLDPYLETIDINSLLSF